MSSVAGERQYSVRTTVVLVQDGRAIAHWPLELHESADMAAVDELARLQLAAHRVGLSIRLDSMAPDLLRALELAGLAIAFR
jgi:hypothetical protein